MPQSDFPTEEERVENYSQKLEQNGDAMFETNTAINEYNSLCPESRYRWLKRVNDIEFVNGVLGETSNNTLHLLKQAGNKWYTEEGGVIETRPLCDGLSKRAHTESRVQDLVIWNDRFCKSCLKKKRRMVGAMDAIRKSERE